MEVNAKGENGKKPEWEENRCDGNIRHLVNRHFKMSIIEWLDSRMIYLFLVWHQTFRFLFLSDWLQLRPDSLWWGNVSILQIHFSLRQSIISKCLFSRRCHLHILNLAIHEIKLDIDVTGRFNVFLLFLKTFYDFQSLSYLLLIIILLQLKNINPFSLNSYL